MHSEQITSNCSLILAEISNTEDVSARGILFCLNEVDTIVIEHYWVLLLSLAQ